MPGLMDMFQPRGMVDNEPIGFGDAIAQNRNSLMGLGMGMLQPRSMAAGAPVTSAWGNALGGYMQGAQTDSANAYRQAQMAHTKRQEAFQRSQAAEAKSHWEQQFAESKMTEAEKLARASGLQPGTPEHAAFIKTAILSKAETPWKTVTDTNTDKQYQLNERTGEVRDIVFPGQTGMAAAVPPAVNWTPGAANAPVYGEGGYSTAPSAPTATAAPAATDPSRIPAYVPGKMDRKTYKEMVTKEEFKQAADVEQKTKRAKMIDPIAEDITRALNETEKYRGNITGGFGALMANIPYSRAHDIAKLVESIKGAAALEKLQEMKSLSQTGASGLGALSEGERKTLENAIGNLDQSQNTEQFLHNLERVQRVRHEIIHGPGTAPAERFPVSEAQRTPAASALKPGDLSPNPLYRDMVFKGGDPADPNNWMKKR